MNRTQNPRLGGLLFSPHLLLGFLTAEKLAVGVFLVGAGTGISIFRVQGLRFSLGFWGLGFGV